MYWWFAYDVIKNMIMQITINLPQIFIWPIKAYNVSVSNLKLFGPMRTELWVKEVGEFPIMLYGRMGWWAFWWAFINEWRFSKL